MHRNCRYAEPTRCCSRQRRIYFPFLASLCYFKGYLFCLSYYNGWRLSTDFAKENEHLIIFPLVQAGKQEEWNKKFEDVLIWSRLAAEEGMCYPVERGELQCITRTFSRRCSSPGPIVLPPSVGTGRGRSWSATCAIPGAVPNCSSPGPGCGCSIILRPPGRLSTPSSRWRRAASW